MPSFTIQQEGQPTRVFRLKEGELTVGRADDAMLVLPDTSVSRRHALISTADDRVEVMDAGSANGTLVNGKEVVRWTLADGDIVQIGTFLLTFREKDEVTGIPELASFRGDDEQTDIGIPDLDQVPPPAPIPEPLRIEPPAPPPVNRRESGRLVPVGGGGEESWPVGDNLRFGKDLPVKGVLPIGTPPTVSWNGAAHVARRESILIPLDVNGRSVREHVLSPGDEIRVGTTRVRYIA